jgi:hypothetical protein
MIMVAVQITTVLYGHIMIFCHSKDYTVILAFDRHKQDLIQRQILVVDHLREECI